MRISGSVVCSLKARLQSFLENASSVAEKSAEAEYKAALKSFADTMSIAMASHSIDSRVKRLRAIFLQGNEEGPFAVFGDSIMRTSAINALFINSFAAHSLELDDWLPLGILHPGASLVPSLTLVAQKSDMSIEDVLRGIIFGYQFAEQLGRWLGKSHYKIWHNSSTIAGMAVGASLSWLDGGSEEQILNSVVIAATYAGGFMPLLNKLVSIKPLSPSHASIVGYFSYLLNSTFSGLNRNLEDVEQKMCQLLTKQCEEFPEDESASPAIFRVGYKVFPTCRNSHTTIQAAIKLSQKVDPSQIESIQIEVFEEAAQVADVRFPTSIEEAMFSLSFLAAASLVKKWIGLKEIRESLSDPQVRDLERKVRISVREDYTLSFPSKHPVTVRIKLKSGETLEEYEEIPYGDPSRNLSEELLYEKIKSLAEYSGNEKISKFVDLILKKRNNIRINELIDELSGEEKKNG